MSEAKSITLPPPDDFHCHIREGDAMETIVPHVYIFFECLI